MTDRSIEVLISRTLRAGILAAAGTGLCGGIWFLAAHGLEPVAFGTFRGADAVFRSPAGVAGALRGAGGDHALALVQLGILLLLATPVLRVGFSLVGFVEERDRVYVAITAIVLTTLLISAFFL